MPSRCFTPHPPQAAAQERDFFIPLTTRSASYRYYSARIHADTCQLGRNFTIAALTKQITAAASFCSPSLTEGAGRQCSSAVTAGLPAGTSSAQVSILLSERAALLPRAHTEQPDRSLTPGDAVSKIWLLTRTETRDRGDC